MNHKMFVIYDQKANAYLQPWFLPKRAMAQRAFMDCVNDEQHNFGRHPEDYTLFQIGNYNDQNAEIESHAKVALGTGLEYLKQEEDEPDFFKTGQDPDNLPLRGNDGEGK